MRPPSLLGLWAALAGALLGAPSLAVATDGAQPRPADFFTGDAERMDELPPPQSLSTDTCHPKCIWRCHNQTCDTSCRPQCQAPKCVTSCKKIRVSTCREVCGKPRCAAVCPPSCEKHTCPECEMVCNEPECRLDCGQGVTRSVAMLVAEAMAEVGARKANNCESTCEDPLCSFDCRPEECPEPKCVLTCEKPKMCTFRKWKRALRPDIYHGQGAGRYGPAPYHGDKFLAWSGFGEVAAGAATADR